MFGKFNMNNIMQSAQEMQKEMEKITVVGESGAGAVSIQMNARHIASRVTLSDEIIADASTNKEVLEELITAAINSAAHKIEDSAKSKMMDMNSMLGSFMGGNDNKDEDK